MEILCSFSLNVFLLLFGSMFLVVRSRYCSLSSMVGNRGFFQFFGCLPEYAAYGQACVRDERRCVYVASDQEDGSVK